MAITILHRLVNRPLAKLGGDVYVLGDSSLFLFGGGLSQHWNEAVSGIGYVIGSLILSKKGDDARWFAVSMAMAIPLAILAVLDALLDGSLFSWVGVTILCIGNLFGALSAPLHHRFCNANHSLLRRTLGQPRKVMGVLSISSKLPLILDAVMRFEWLLIGVVGSWIVGDILLGLSPVEAEADRLLAWSTTSPIGE